MQTNAWYMPEIKSWKIISRSVSKSICMHVRLDLPYHIYQSAHPYHQTWMQRSNSRSEPVHTFCPLVSSAPSNSWFVLSTCVRTDSTQHKHVTGKQPIEGRAAWLLLIFTCLPGRQGGKFHRMDGWMPHACLPACLPTPKLNSKSQLSSTIFGADVSDIQTFTRLA